ncbi:ABC transporter ATP-binding protein [Patescibacteria group bacterium]|nr:ABC transporter ATP-binding protein [Patescibacteria group bacterium]
MDDNLAVKVTNVGKVFKLPHERANTLKGTFTSMLKMHKGSVEIQHALSDINLEIKKGEFFGIVGRNGSGKSTLLKIIAGIYQPTTGQVQINGKLMPFIELGVGFNGELTGRENIYLNGAMTGFSRAEINSMYKDIVSFAELEKFMDQKLKNYSSGMQVRLAFSLAIRAKAEILLIDEVLAVGDADFQKKCFRYFKNLKKEKKTVIFVSHDMNAIQEYCDRAMLIEGSRPVITGAAYDVSMAYTRMFIEQNQGKESKGDVYNRKKRWGDWRVKYTSVSINCTKLTDKETFFILEMEALASDYINNECVFGFKIRNEKDEAIMGTNTKLKNHSFSKFTKGQKIELVWQVPNILNTGLYYVDLAIQNESYEDVYDWWEEAVQFSVEKREQNPYSIFPQYKLTVQHVSQPKK